MPTGFQKKEREESVYEEVAECELPKYENEHKETTPPTGTSAPVDSVKYQYVAEVELTANPVYTPWPYEHSQATLV